MSKQESKEGKEGDKKKRQAMQKLADALNLLWDGHVETGSDVKRELQFADIWPGVQGLEMDVVLISFDEQSKLVRHKIAFTVDWMLSETTGAIARQINEQISEKLAAV